MRATAPQTSVAAPSPATADEATTIVKPRGRRVSASAPIAAIHSSGYQLGHPAGACHSTGPAAAAIAPNTGATSGGSPRARPSTTRPAVAPAMSSADAGRKSASCQLTHNCRLAPNDGGLMPRERSRSRNGPTAMTASSTSAETRRDASGRPERSTANSASSATVLVSASAPRLAA